MALTLCLIDNDEGGGHGRHFRERLWVPSISTLTEEEGCRWQLTGLWLLCDRQITMALYS